MRYSPGGDVEGEAQARRVAERSHADERVGVDPPREGARRHAVDRVAYGHLAVVVLALRLEQLDRPLDHVAQTGALALREVADRVLHVGRRIAVAGEDRFVDLQRVGVGVAVAEVGVREEGVAEDQRQLLVGDDLVVGAGAREERREEAERERKGAFHRRLSAFTMLCTVRFVSAAASAAKAASTAARSPGRNSTG